MSDPIERVHVPRTADDLAALIGDAGRRGAALRIQGAGTWRGPLDLVDAREAIDLRAFAGVLDHASDDLTISVGAATTLAELDEATRAANQWCPLLSWGDDDGTVGATVATATAGPFASALGRPRDLVTGLEAVDGLGRIVRAGGRVVKNVAGFDLVRLMTGQWGTLGVITTVHLRLRARPAADETFLLHARGHEPVDIARLDAFVRGPHAPLACMPHGTGRWLVRCAGNAAFLRAAIVALKQVGDVESVEPTVWDGVRREHAPMPALGAWRWDTLSMRVKERFDPHDVLNRGLLGSPAAHAREVA